MKKRQRAGGGVGGLAGAAGGEETEALENTDR